MCCFRCLSLLCLVSSRREWEKNRDRADHGQRKMVHHLFYFFRFIIFIFFANKRNNENIDNVRRTCELNIWNESEEPFWKLGLKQWCPIRYSLIADMFNVIWMRGLIPMLMDAKHSPFLPQTHKTDAQQCIHSASGGNVRFSCANVEIRAGLGCKWLHFVLLCCISRYIDRRYTEDYHLQ